MRTDILKILRAFEIGIIWILLVMMMLVLLISVVQLGYTIYDYVSDEPFHILDEKIMMSLLGSILIVLIGIELMDTIKIYLKDDVVHVEIVILVAVIALARKIIVMDFDKYSALSIIGLAALLVTLGMAYYMIKHADFHLTLPQKTKKKEDE